MHLQRMNHLVHVVINSVISKVNNASQLSVDSRMPFEDRTLRILVSDMKMATCGIINFTTPDRACGSRRRVFSYGYPLVSLPSYRNSHVWNTYKTRATRLFVYLRDISHYQGEPTTGMKEREKERERRAYFFSFHPADVLARIDTYGSIQTGDLNTHENLHSHTLSSW